MYTYLAPYLISTADVWAKVLAVVVTMHPTFSRTVDMMETLGALPRIADLQLCGLVDIDF